MKNQVKDIIYKDRFIEYLRDYDKYYKSKEKEDNYKLFYYGRATMIFWCHLILNYKKKPLYQSLFLKVLGLISYF